IGGTLTATGHWITTITAVDSHGAATTITIDWLVLENHQVDLSVTGSVDGQTTSAEATVQFEIRIENRGPAGVAHAPAFSMTIPGNIVSPYADGTIYWRCSVESGGAVTMVGTSNHLEASLPSHIATLQAGASIVCDTLPLRAANRLVKPYTFTGDSVTLSATVTASNDGFADDNTAVLVRNR
ncbi:MAG: hypothetical protein LAO77_22800, partial [Acidobacteriia bacterium]|nr:hypothetical protein [Terriglobia bacterium]